MKTVEEFLKKILKKVGNFNNSRVFLRIFFIFTPSNSEIICVQNMGAKVELVSYFKKINEN